MKGMALAALHVQNALVARAKTALVDPDTGLEAVLTAYGIPWPRGDRYPTQLFDEPPPDALPCYRLGPLRVDNEGGGSSREYILTVPIDALATPVMGRPVVLAMAAAMEAALLISDDPEEDRWPQSALAVTSATGGTTTTDLRIVDCQVATLDLTVSELAGSPVYSAGLAAEFSLWEPE